MIIIKQDKVLAEVGLEFGEHSILVDRFSRTQIGFGRVKLLNEVLLF